MHPGSADLDGARIVQTTGQSGNPFDSQTYSFATGVDTVIDLPFEVLVVFATNLKPDALADEAFLRRIPYKIRAKNPTSSAGDGGMRTANSPPLVGRFTASIREASTCPVRAWISPW